MDPDQVVLFGNLAQISGNLPVDLQVLLEVVGLEVHQVQAVVKGGPKAGVRVTAVKLFVLLLGEGEGDGLVAAPVFGTQRTRLWITLAVPPQPDALGLRVL